ncbi:cardiolipin synthase [Parvularcula dongshanensis]|uniref:Cardiolipin synthase n=1 Tax=Parvularcula dongshanensis TaxID=1173995 RepID=A0A840I4B2_9PROT|nr:cardiolipin synthase [Parvularcula dongshanensis]
MESSTIFFWFDVVFYIGAVGCGLHSLMANRTAQGTLAWMLALFALPYAAVPLYFVFGRRHFGAYASGLKRAQERVRTKAEVERFLAYEPESPRHAARGLEVAEDIGGAGYTTGNCVTLLQDGYETFEAIFEAIDRAEAYVLVQFYIFRDDDLGRRLRDRMVAAAGRGVRCCLLYDEIGCFTTPRSYWAGFTKAGVKVSAFGARRPLRGRFELNFRNHRKIVVCDGNVAFVGGNNVGDEYLGESKRFGAWRDAHVRIEGPLVQAAQLAFQQDWEFAAGEVLPLEWQAQRAENGNQIAMILPTGPADNLETGSLMFVAAINSAQKRLWIVSPYFVPDQAVMSALKLASLRGVEVRVMVPDKPDHLAVWLAGFDFIEEAERAGIEAYRYTGGFLHQKAVLIDHDIAMIGTANMDNRSFRLNFEVTVIVADEGFAACVEDMIEKDFEKAREHVETDYQQRSVLFKLAVRGARLLAPVL